MNNSIRCDRFKEDLPLFFSGQLGDEEKHMMQIHLKACPDCRSLFRSEAALMAVASADKDQHLFGDHPACESLDNYVHSRSSLNSSRIAAIDEHVEHCDWCRDSVERLQLLPQELNDLVSPEEISFIDSLAGPQVIDVSRMRPARTASVRSWRWMGALAAAALVVLVGILLVTDRYPGELQQSRVEMQFVESGESTHLQELRRSATGRPTVREVKGWISIEIGFDAYPDEESYRVVIEGPDGEVAEKNVSVDDFSKPGILMMRINTARLSPGEYQLKLYMYTLDRQTLTATQTFPFELERD